MDFDILFVSRVQMESVLSLMPIVLYILCQMKLVLSPMPDLAGKTRVHLARALALSDLPCCWP